MKPIIFLDIDGVLNNANTVAKTPEGFTGIGNSLLNNLYHLVKEFDASVVLISTWKDEWDVRPELRTPEGVYLNKKLAQKGIRILGKISDEGCGLSHRGAAIAKYINDHEFCEETPFVILDDGWFDYADYPELFEKWVEIDPAVGFSKDYLEQAKDLLLSQFN